MDIENAVAVVGTTTIVQGGSKNPIASDRLHLDLQTGAKIGNTQAGERIIIKWAEQTADTIKHHLAIRSGWKKGFPMNSLICC